MDRRAINRILLSTPFLGMFKAAQLGAAPITLGSEDVRSIMAIENPSHFANGFTLESWLYDGAYRHIALVYDRQQNAITEYLDGSKVASGGLAGRFPGFHISVSPTQVRMVSTGLVTSVNGVELTPGVPAVFPHHAIRL